MILIHMIKLLLRTTEREEVPEINLFDTSQISEVTHNKHTKKVKLRMN